MSVANKYKENGNPIMMGSMYTGYKKRRLNPRMDTPSTKAIT